MGRIFKKKISMNAIDLIAEELWDHYSGLPNPAWYQYDKQLKHNEMTQEELEAKMTAQLQLIRLLEVQIIDLTVMSKIELGDDVIAEIQMLKRIINE